MMTEGSSFLTQGFLTKQCFDCADRQSGFYRIRYFLKQKPFSGCTKGGNMKSFHDLD